MLDASIVRYDKCFLSSRCTFLHIGEQLFNFHLTVNFSDFLFLSRVGFILRVRGFKFKVGDKKLILRARVALGCVCLRSLAPGDLIEACQSDFDL